MYRIFSPKAINMTDITPIITISQDIEPAILSSPIWGLFGPFFGYRVRLRRDIFAQMCSMVPNKIYRLSCQLCYQYLPLVYSIADCSGLKWQAIKIQHFIIARALLKGYVKIGDWE